MKKTALALLGLIFLFASPSKAQQVIGFACCTQSNPLVVPLTGTVPAGAVEKITVYSNQTIPVTNPKITAGTDAVVPVGAPYGIYTADMDWQQVYTVTSSAGGYNSISIKQSGNAYMGAEIVIEPKGAIVGNPVQNNGTNSVSIGPITCTPGDIVSASLSGAYQPFTNYGGGFAYLQGGTNNDNQGAIATCPATKSLTLTAQINGKWFGTLIDIATGGSAPPPPPPPNPPTIPVITITNPVSGTFNVSVNGPVGSTVTTTVSNATGTIPASGIFTAVVAMVVHSPAGQNTVVLSWTASVTPGVIKYNVFRSQTSGSFGTTPLANVTGVTYTDTSVASGQTYYYVVQAVSPVCPATPACGVSVNSNQVSATVPN